MYIVTESYRELLHQWGRRSYFSYICLALSFEPPVVHGRAVLPTVARAHGRGRDKGMPSPMPSCRLCLPAGTMPPCLSVCRGHAELIHVSRIHASSHLPCHRVLQHYTLPRRDNGRGARVHGDDGSAGVGRSEPCPSSRLHVRVTTQRLSRSTQRACLSGGSTITPPSQCGLRLHASSSRSCPARPHRSVSSHCGRVHVWPQPAQCAGLLADQLQGSVMLRYNKRVL